MSSFSQPVQKLSRPHRRTLPPSVETAKVRDQIDAPSPLGHGTVALWTFKRIYSFATMNFPSPYPAPTVGKITPYPHPKYEYCIHRPWVFVDTLRGSAGILWPSMATYPTSVGITSTSYPQISVELHNPCVRKIGGRSWTLTRFHAHVTMIIPSPCQAPTDFARIPPTPNSSMYTVSIDRGFLRVL